MWTEWNRSAHSLNTKIVKIIQLQILLAKENWNVNCELSEIGQPTPWSRELSKRAVNELMWRRNCIRDEKVTGARVAVGGFAVCSHFPALSVVDFLGGREGGFGILGSDVKIINGHLVPTMVLRSWSKEYYASTIFFLSNKSCNVGPFRQTAPLMCHVIVFSHQGNAPPSRCVTTRSCRTHCQDKQAWIHEIYWCFWPGTNCISLFRLFVGRRRRCTVVEDSLVNVACAMMPRLIFPASSSHFLLWKGRGKFESEKWLNCTRTLILDLKQGSLPSNSQISYFKQHVSRQLIFTAFPARSHSVPLSFEVFTQNIISLLHTIVSFSCG